MYHKYMWRGLQHLRRWSLHFIWWQEIWIQWTVWIHPCAGKVADGPNAHLPFFNIKLVWRIRIWNLDAGQNYVIYKCICCIEQRWNWGVHCLHCLLLSLLGLLWWQWQERQLPHYHWECPLWEKRYLLQVPKDLPGGKLMSFKCHSIKMFFI